MGFNSVNSRYLDWLPKNKTIFPVSKNIKTTGNLGELIPLGFFEGLPGDTFKFSTESLTRIISPTVKATLESLKINIMHFQIPLRILYDAFKKVMGERDDYELPNSSYKVPLIEFVDDLGQPVNNYAKSILAYLGVPIPSKADITAGRKLANINKLLSNAYALVWNNFFRDQNLQAAKVIDTSDNNIKFIPLTIDDPGNPGTQIPNPDADFNTSAPDKYTGKLAKINKNFDYFTNTFTDTQKGEAVVLSLAGSAPVVTGQVHLQGENEPMILLDSPTGNVHDVNRILGVQGQNSSPIANPTTPGSLIAGFAGNDANTNVTGQTPGNLYADLSEVSAIGINDLREAEKLQKQRELDLVAGTRYFEMINSYFGVMSNLGLLDVPQYLGGSTGSVEVSQVVQTSLGFDDTTAQGNVAGYGVKVNMHSGVNVTLQEHAVIMSFAVYTQKHTYQQGLHKFFNRREKNDFFNPVQIGLGFQPIYVSEIYGNLTDAERYDVFGFAPANERYRKETSIITGMLNANSRDVEDNGNSLSAWHAGDVYDVPPVLTPDWKLEKPIFLDNALVLGSTVVDQFLLDINFKGVKVSSVDALGVPTI